jgi:hypothetical protein
MMKRELQRLKLCSRLALAKLELKEALRKLRLAEATLRAFERKTSRERGRDTV